LQDNLFFYKRRKFLDLSYLHEKNPLQQSISTSSEKSDLLLRKAPEMPSKLLGVLKQNLAQSKSPIGGNLYGKRDFESTFLNKNELPTANFSKKIKIGKISMADSKPFSQPTLTKNQSALSSYFSKSN
jgi:hypothetical protein